MKNFKTLILSMVGVLVFASFGIVATSQQKTAPGKPKKVYQPVTQTKESQAMMTPARALQMLKDGNERFVNGEFINRDARAQIKATSGGQYPFATILSCQRSEEHTSELQSR